MSRILVLGTCPLPFEDTPMNFAPGRRTWQFGQPLAQAGHQVQIAALRTPFVYPEETPDVLEYERDGVHIYNIEEHVFQQDPFLQELCRSYQPGALIGATIYGAAAAGRLPFDLPRWVDFHGHPMAEAQAKAALDGSDEVLPYFWAMVKDALEQADRISVSSRFQRHAVIGELGALGRLNHRTAGTELVEIVPSALEPRAFDRPTRSLLRGVKVPQEAFIVLWSGGYNVWADCDTLFLALESAMRREPRIWFVSTGGEIRGHDSSTFQAFRRRAADSRYASRFVFEGWLARAGAELYPFESDVGIILDRFLYEGLLGHRTRILEWMRYGLPAICSAQGEAAELVREAGAGWPLPLGGAETVADLLIELAVDPAAVRARGERGRGYALEHCSYQATTRSVQQWAQRPSFAPDHEPAKS